MGTPETRQLAKQWLTGGSHGWSKHVQFGGVVLRHGGAILKNPPSVLVESGILPFKFRNLKAIGSPPTPPARGDAGHSKTSMEDSMGEKVVTEGLPRLLVWPILLSTSPCLTQTGGGCCAGFILGRFQLLRPHQQGRGIACTEFSRRPRACQWRYQGTGHALFTDREGSQVHLTRPLACKHMLFS